MATKTFGNLYQPSVVSIRCPICGENGTFHGIYNVQDAAFYQTKTDRGRTVGLPFIYGIRVCPNPRCVEPIFVVLGENFIVGRTYPAERLDFNPTGIPGRILGSFEEAINCHANACYRAGAMMVRRTLEEICEDRGAVGGNLKERVAALSTKIIVPKELLEAADELRILGNDAAHLEAKVYDDIGKEEVEAAIDLCKEILKAVYQLSSLVGRLRALKKP